MPKLSVPVAAESSEDPAGIKKFPNVSVKFEPSSPNIELVIEEELLNFAILLTVPEPVT